MARRRTRRSRRMLTPEVTLTPLIDTALTLLVIFMISAPVMHYGLKVDLPEGRQNEVADKQQIIVAFDSQGKIYCNDELVAYEVIGEHVKKIRADGNDLPVHVHADKGLSYGKVMGLIDELKAAGVRYVALSTKAIQG